jgi:hypothetical protein
LKFLLVGLILAGSIVATARVEAASMTVSWLAPTANADGTPLTDLAGFRIYIATSTPPCPSASFFTVPSPTTTPAPGQTVSSIVTQLTAGTTYVTRVTAVDAQGNESACSASASGVATGTNFTLTYHAQDDFSSTQGYRNWYYLYGSGTPMTFDTTAGWWQGNEQYLLLWANGAHPGSGADAIRQWVAPQAGSVRITGNAGDVNAGCGGGVSVSIAKNATVLWQQTLANGNTAGIGFDLTTTVLQGDGVNFSVSRGPDGNNYCDATGFDPTIVFTPAGATTYHAQDDYSGIQGYRNWYYLYGSGTPMTFDSTAGWWRGNETWLVLWESGALPGNGSDAIRRWVAPQTGSVRITGNAGDIDARCGGGVMVSIAKNATVLWQQTLANGNTAGIGFDLTTTVLQGDGVNFSVSRGPDGNNNCDATGFDPTIVFTPS